MELTVKTHRKLANGGYRLEIEDADGQVFGFDFSSIPVDAETGKPIHTVGEYEALQLRESKLLIESIEDEGKKLKSEGKKL